MELSLQTHTILDVTGKVCFIRYEAVQNCLSPLSIKL